MLRQWTALVYHTSDKTSPDSRKTSFLVHSYFKTIGQNNKFFCAQIMKDMRYAQIIIVTLTKKWYGTLFFQSSVSSKYIIHILAPADLVF